MELLRRAAERSASVGAPAEAAVFLHRALEEPPPEPDRVPLLLALAEATITQDIAAAAGHLRAALRLATGPVERARIAALLGEAATYVQPTEQAMADLERAVAELEREEGGVPAEDLRRRLAATMLFTAFASRSGRGELPERMPRLRGLAEHPGPGARMLDCAIAYQDAMTGRPDAAERARRALSGGLLETSEHTVTALALALAVLLLAEDPDAMPRLDALMADARRRGSLRILASVSTVRARGWLLAGQLAEAETDARAGWDAARIYERAGLRTTVLGPVVRAALGDTLILRGELDEAGRVLAAAGPPHLLGGPRARLRLAAATLRRWWRGRRWRSAGPPGSWACSIRPWCSGGLRRRWRCTPRAARSGRGSWRRRNWSWPGAGGRPLRSAGRCGWRPPWLRTGRARWSCCGSRSPCWRVRRPGWTGRRRRRTWGRRCTRPGSPPRPVRCCGPRWTRPTSAARTRWRSGCAPRCGRRAGVRGGRRCPGRGRSPRASCGWPSWRRRG
ncbi:hypothetical protein HUT16_32050 [Kitasatospora sp. NA04385]|uniref:hypothetical protein n=1 Tax=Kitasatospora sp. NA04385 TaxID=2742135 RepID=UPI0015903C6B|nr:hypothetical protein [Kitasatospora sp. NA04385]QKW23108.1 hypothetical protein HUT16_32050 [Kitasatospora sp. NA04385]